MKHKACHPKCVKAKLNKSVKGDKAIGIFKRIEAYYCRMCGAKWNKTIVTVNDEEFIEWLRVA